MLLRRRSTAVGSTPHAIRLDRRRLRAMRASDRRAQATRNVLYEAIAQQSPQAKMASLIGLVTAGWAVVAQGRSARRGGPILGGSNVTDADTFTSSSSERPSA